MLTTRENRPLEVMSSFQDGWGWKRVSLGEVGTFGELGEAGRACIWVQEWVSKCEAFRRLVVSSGLLIC